MKRSSSHKRRWGTLIEAAKAGRVSRLIGRSRSEDSVCNSHCRENSHSHSHSHSNSPASDENGTESPTDSNPSLEVPPEAEPDIPEMRSHQPQHESHHGLGALAALRRKRKKFSASRNQSPIVAPSPNPVEHAIAVCIGKANKKVLKRASSVPTRVTEVVQMVMPHKHEHSQSQQQSIELPSVAVQPLTPSTTEESFGTSQIIPTVNYSSSGDGLLNSSSSTQATGSTQTPEEEYKHNGQVSLLSKIPGVIPLSGHNGGWL